MKKIAAVFFILFVFGYAVTVSGKSKINIDGTWQGEFENKPRQGMMGGPAQAPRKMQLTFNFKKEGDILKGSVNGGGPGQWIPITDGKIKGKKISFTVHSSYGAMVMTFNYKGKVKGDKIKMKFETVTGQNNKNNPQSLKAAKSRRGGGMGMGGGMGGGGLNVGPAMAPPPSSTQKIVVERISDNPQGPVY